MKWSVVIFCCALLSITGGSIPTYKLGYPPLSPRIVGGTDADEGFALYQCSIQWNGRHNCGCAIISTKFILSAAHCLHGTPKSIAILVGTNDLKKGGSFYKAEKLITHEQYNQPHFAYDIGLIQVHGEIEFNEKVQPIKYSNKIIADGVSLQVTGWGRLSEFGSISQRLQVLNVKSISQEECKEFHGSNVHDSHLCTFSKVGEGVCSGDSGGPLVFGDELVGLANWALLCARGVPDGFARISYLYDWVQNKTAFY